MLGAWGLDTPGDQRPGLRSLAGGHPGTGDGAGDQPHPPPAGPPPPPADTPRPPARPDPPPHLWPLRGAGLVGPYRRGRHGSNRVTTLYTLVRNEAGSREQCNSASMNTFLL